MAQPHPPTSAQDPRPADASPRRVVVLGSTGSIGVNTLAVIEHLTRTGRCPFEVVGLAASRNAKQLAEQAQQFGCPAVAIADPLKASALSADHVFAGADAAQQLVEHAKPDLVVSAIVGAAGLPATVAAIKQGCTVALANKETLVAAGDWVMPLAREHDAALLPIDSEHSAIFQALGQTTDTTGVRRVVLTASGGPFRDWPAEKMRDATPEQALNHPTWDMGPKITIDSATMMNKALEIIEAHHLFDLPPEKIEAVIHPQSVVHSFVEFADHSVLAQLGPPDMRTPIQVALTHPERLAGCSDQLDWNKLRQLDFHPPDGERFPALPLAYQCIRAGGTAGAVLNAANEVAVQAFLEHRIRFGRIVELVGEALTAIPAVPIKTLTDVFQADQQARDFVSEQLKAPATSDS
ncbi:1-deoxy-D-xylulose-5-phosphate reductoisomerase [Algisphaera agarilytica]|uniref:1-deoxy-D-xylulose 5-phosphate reductoisomerase n=1 Tax=Algisphaera agarilytica TaxID=1385975 RepID=A0A7X0LIW5_9BACT|nr:1-deoxy-D-xylulose-5-phosphate reductoisomerase [Algisphaera agarilytica]MBB6428222.1 1-deoxy-D-xylulose-5-phosphate reductoisomerase [Algisphaera agarilytica]